MSDYPQITYKRYTFLSALTMGLSALVITFIISCTVVIIYGIHFAGDKSEKLVSLVEDAIRGLPVLQESLPPVLADILNDRRQPDYCTQLEITAKTTMILERNGRVGDGWIRHSEGAPVGWHGQAKLGRGLPRAGGD